MSLRTSLNRAAARKIKEEQRTRKINLATQGMSEEERNQFLLNLSRNQESQRASIAAGLSEITDPVAVKRPNGRSIAEMAEKLRVRGDGLVQSSESLVSPLELSEEPSPTSTEEVESSLPIPHPSPLYSTSKTEEVT